LILAVRSINIDWLGAKDVVQEGNQSFFVLIFWSVNLTCYSIFSDHSSINIVL